MANAASPPAVVAARSQLLGFRSGEDMLAAEIKLVVVCRGHGRSDCAQQRRAAQKAPDTLSVAWLRGVFRRDARASPAAFRDYVSCLDDVYADARPSGVPPPVHERSHENARLAHAPVPWQVVGSLQRLFHESILSIPSLPH